MARRKVEGRAMYRAIWMVDESSAPVRRLLFTRAPPQAQQSPKTPFDKLPERQGKDVNSGEVGTARLIESCRPRRMCMVMKLMLCGRPLFMLCQPAKSDASLGM